MFFFGSRELQKFITWLVFRSRNPSTLNPLHPRSGFRRISYPHYYIVYIYINTYYIILYPHSKSLYPPKKLYYHIWALVIWGFSMVFRSHGGTQSSKSSTSMDFPWTKPSIPTTGRHRVPRCPGVAPVVAPASGPNDTSPGHPVGLHPCRAGRPELNMPQWICFNGGKWWKMAKMNP